VALVSIHISQVSLEKYEYPIVALYDCSLDDVDDIADIIVGDIGAGGRTFNS